MTFLDPAPARRTDPIHDPTPHRPTVRVDGRVSDPIRTPWRRSGIVSRWRTRRSNR